ncbi:hypothetical protein Lal_00000221 [Lupinus albus]|uniref:Putative FMN-binding split barrel n=1 Tax=Lupinus albus TaxID=3870 RepID=A0A6A4NJQ8_LUPAL|nr:putative FMN-binding split barrel [Lupinus albus]KAF1860808.1 hypothetical protein Lal_00000221 [Lupinus albus]
MMFPVVPHDVCSRVAHIASLPQFPYNYTPIATTTFFKTRNKLVNNTIRASSSSSSHNDPVNKDGKSSYHPFEEIPEPIISQHLTPAEISRTLIQVNSKATMVFAVLIDGEDYEHVVWPDLPYLTDEHGNIYFQMKNGQDVLQSLTSEDNYVQVVVGVDTMEMLSEMDLSGPSEINFGIQEIDDEDSEDVDNIDEEDEDDNDDYDSEWVSVLSDEDEQVDADESLPVWAKSETMRFSHPVDFAKTLAEIASDDPFDWMEQPPACLAIQGLIRPAFIEEHSIIQKHISDSQSGNTDTSEPIDIKGEDVTMINGHVHNLGSSGDTAAEMENTENSDIPINGTTFYKLEMTKIQVFSAHGRPTLLEVEDYMKAQPDAIAHSASKIISRLKAGGEKTVQALKSLCLRCKAIQVEEAQLVCIDSLGFDLRVCSGTQVQTLRFAFKTRATSEYSAERQLNDILFPRVHQRTKQTHQNEC